MFFFLLWSCIACIYYEDLESGLKLVNKFTSDHINLTSYSVMIAAQVLRETIGNVWSRRSSWNWKAGIMESFN